MLPGGGMNPRQMAQMMRKLGIDVEEIPDIQEVVVRTATKDYVFAEASVSVMKAQGVETWQISGVPAVQQHEARVKVSEDDVRLVMEQCGCDEAAARAALEDTGDLAAAIVKLSG